MRLSPHLALILLVLTGCCGSDSFDVQSDLKIDRRSPDDVAEHDDGSVTRKFPLLCRHFNMLVVKSGDDGTAGNPLAEPLQQDRIVGATRPARKILEGFDIPFPDGSEFDAVYDLNAEILTVRHEPEWVDLVEAVLESYGVQERLINIRVEIYQVPKTLAWRLEQSAGGEAHSDHTPEWDALQKIVREGDATVVTSCNIRSRSGQRAHYQDGAEQVLFSGIESDKTKDPPLREPVMDARFIGTIVEYDPVLGADDVTVDLNLLLVHHTASPTTALLEVPVPGKEETVSIEAPVFHANKLVTMLTLKDGGTRLLCSWRPTGSPEFEGGDLMRIAFLRADVQKVPSGYE